MDQLEQLTRLQTDITIADVELDLYKQHLARIEEMLTQARDLKASFLKIADELQKAAQS